MFASLALELRRSQRVAISSSPLTLASARIFFPGLKTAGRSSIETRSVSTQLLRMGDCFDDRNLRSYGRPLASNIYDDLYVLCSMKAILCCHIPSSHSHTYCLILSLSVPATISYLCFSVRSFCFGLVPCLVRWSCVLCLERLLLILSLITNDDRKRPLHRVEKWSPYMLRYQDLSGLPRCGSFSLLFVQAVWEFRHGRSLL